MQDRQAEIARMNSQIRYWETKLKTLEAKAAPTGADANAGLQQQIEKLRSEIQETQQALDKNQEADSQSSVAGRPICCAPGDISGVCQINDDGE